MRDNKYENAMEMETSVFDKLEGITNLGAKNKILKYNGNKICEKCFREGNEEDGYLVAVEFFKFEYQYNKKYKVYQCVYCGELYYELCDRNEGIDFYDEE